MENVVRYEKSEAEKIDVSLGWGQVTFTAEPIEKLQVIATGDEESVKELRIFHENNEVFIQQPQYGLTVNINSTKWLEVLVRIPEGWEIDVEARTVGGVINVKNLSGEQLCFDTVSGNIVASDITCEERKMKTISGDIRGKNFTADEVALRTVSGDIKVGGITGDELNIRTISGTVAVEQIAYEEIAATSVSGKFVLGCVKIFKQCDCNTVSGDFSLYVPVKKVHIIHRGLRGNVRTEGVDETGEGAKVKVTSVTGDLSIISTLN